MSDKKLEVSLTNRDYPSLESDIFQKVKDWSNNQYTDFNDSDPGIILLKVFMKLVDMCNYYIDKRAAECFPDRAVERKNIRSMLRLLGYKMHGYKSAEVEVTMTINPTLSETIEIPKFTLLDSDVPYVTKDKITISAGMSEVKFTAVQGTVKTFNFNVSDIDEKGRLYLNVDNLSEDHYYLTVSGIEWTQVDNVYLLGSSGRYFHIDYDNDDNAYIQFIPGYITYLSGTTGDIEIKALESLGEDGAITSGVIRGFAQEIKDSQGNDIRNNLTFSHGSSSSGKNKQTESEALIESRKNLRTMDTLVSLYDWEYFCESFDEVRKALAVDVSVPEANNPTQLPPYYVKVYVIGYNGQTVSQSTKDEIVNDINLNSRCIRGTTFDIVDGTPYVFSGSITVHLKDGLHSETVIENKILEKWNEFFDSEDRQYGEEIKFMKIASYLVKAHESILYIESGVYDSQTQQMINTIDDVNLNYNEFPVAGTLDVNFVMG